MISKNNQYLKNFMKKTFIFYFTTLVSPEAGRWPKERVNLIFIFIGFFVKHVKFTCFT